MDFIKNFFPNLKKWTIIKEKSQNYVRMGITVQKYLPHVAVNFVDSTTYYGYRSVEVGPADAVLLLSCLLNVSSKDRKNLLDIAFRKWLKLDGFVACLISMDNKLKEVLYAGIDFPVPPSKWDHGQCFSELELKVDHCFEHTIVKDYRSLDDDTIEVIKTSELLEIGYGDIDNERVRRIISNGLPDGLGFYNYGLFQLSRCKVRPYDVKKRILKYAVLVIIGVITIFAMKG